MYIGGINMHTWHDLPEGTELQYRYSGPKEDARRWIHWDGSIIEANGRVVQTPDILDDAKFHQLYEIITVAAHNSRPWHGKLRKVPFGKPITDFLADQQAWKGVPILAPQAPQAAPEQYAPGKSPGDPAFDGAEESLFAAGKAAAPGDWLASLTSAERKECAVSRGFFAYFPDAIAVVARHSVRMNEKHNPGQPVHWARGKSIDQADCEARHLIAASVNPDVRDADGAYEIVCKAWRAMADLQLWIERKHARGEKI